MDLEKISELYLYILDEWRRSEACCINENGNVEDHDELQLEYENHKRDFFQALNS